MNKFEKAIEEKILSYENEAKESSKIDNILNNRFKTLCKHYLNWIDSKAKESKNKTLERTVSILKELFKRYDKMSKEFIQLQNEKEYFEHEFNSLVGAHKREIESIQERIDLRIKVQELEEQIEIIKLSK
jgi:hypothetical protein